MYSIYYNYKMSSYSTEQAARLVQTLSFILALFGKALPVSQDELIAWISALMFVAATAYGWWKRYQRGDLRLSGTRQY